MEVEEAMSKARAEAMKVAGAVAMMEAGVGVEGAMVAVEGEEWGAAGEGTERRHKLHGLLVFLQCMLYIISGKKDKLSELSEAISYV